MVRPASFLRSSWKTAYLCRSIDRLNNAPLLRFLFPSAFSVASRWGEFARIAVVPLQPFSSRASVDYEVDSSRRWFLRFLCYPPTGSPVLRNLVGCLLIPTTLMGFYPSQFCSRHPASDGFPSDLTHLPLDLYSPRLIFVEGNIAVSERRCPC